MVESKTFYEEFYDDDDVVLQWLWLWFIMLCKSSEEVCDLLRFLFLEEPMSSSTQFVDFLPKQRAVINVRDGTCFASNDIKNV